MSKNYYINSEVGFFLGCTAIQNLEKINPYNLSSLIEKFFLNISMSIYKAINKLLLFILISFITFLNSISHHLNIILGIYAIMSCF